MPCWPSVPNSKPAKTRRKKETETIMDIEEIPSWPSLLNSPSITIPCFTCGCCFQCCCEKNSNTKDRSVRKTKPMKKSFSRNVYSHVIIQQILNIFQMDPPNTSKVNIQTENSLCSSCTYQTQPKKSVNKLTMTFVSNLVPLNNDPARALNSIHIIYPTSLNNNALKLLKNNSRLPMSPGTNDIVLSDWLPQMEMESTKKSRQRLLRMLVLEEQKQMKRFKMLKRKYQMSKCKDSPNTFRSSSSDPSCSSSSPDLCEGLVLSNQYHPSLPHIESSSLPSKLYQRVLVKRLNRRLEEAHKLGQRLLCYVCLDVCVASACTQTRSRRKTYIYVDKTTKRIDDGNSMSFDSEDYITDRNKWKNREITDDIFQPAQNVDLFMSHCFSQNANEKANSNLNPFLEVSGASKSQNHFDWKEILRSFINGKVVQKKDGRLAGGGDNTIPPDRFPSCHRVMLSGSLSRMNNCPLVSHMRCMAELFQKSGCEGWSDCLEKPVIQWDSNKDDETGKNIKVPFQNESDSQVAHGLEEILVEDNKLQKKGVAGILKITNSSDNELVSRSPQVGRLHEFRITDNTEESTPINALLFGKIETLPSYSPVRNASASCKKIMLCEQKMRNENNQSDVENMSTHETKNERRHNFQFNEPSHCCKKLSELKTHFGSEKCAPEMKPNLLPMKEGPMSLGFVRERLQLHKMMMNSAFPLSPIQARFCSHLHDKNIGVSASIHNENCIQSHFHLPTVISKHSSSVVSFLPHEEQNFRNCRSSKSLTSIASSKPKFATDSSCVLETVSFPLSRHNNTLSPSPTKDLVHDFPRAEPPALNNPFKEVILGKMESVMSPTVSTCLYHQPSIQSTSSTNIPSSLQHQIPNHCHYSRSLSSSFSHAMDQNSPYQNVDVIKKDKCNHYCCQNSLGSRSNSCICLLHCGSSHRHSLDRLHSPFSSSLDPPTLFCSHFPQIPTGSSQHYLHPVTDGICLHHAPHYRCPTKIFSKNASGSTTLKTSHEEHPATNCSTFPVENLTDKPVNCRECIQRVGSGIFLTEQTKETDHDRFLNTENNDPAVGYQLPEEIHSNFFSGNGTKKDKEEAKNAIFITGNNGKTGEDMKNCLRSSEYTAELHHQIDKACVMTTSSEILTSREDLTAKGNAFKHISPFLSSDSEILSEQEEQIKNEPWNNPMRACAEAIVSRIQNANANDENIRYCYPVRECAKAIISCAHGTSENPILEAYNQRRAKIQHYHFQTPDHIWLRTSPRDKDSDDSKESDSEYEESTRSDLLMVPSPFTYSPMGEVALFPPEYEPDPKMRRFTQSYQNLISLMNLI